MERKINEYPSKNAANIKRVEDIFDPFYIRLISLSND